MKFWSKIKSTVVRVEAGACVREHGYCCPQGTRMVYDCNGYCKFSSTCP